MRWTLQEAMIWIRNKHLVTKAKGWYLMLGGGVLEHGCGPGLELAVCPLTRNSLVSDFVEIFPGGKWSDIGVAKTYSVEDLGRPVIFVFQIYAPEV